MAAAVRSIRAGGLAAFPTETVYGLGADATSPAAVARIFEVKGRPRFNPLIAHVVEPSQATAEGLFTPEAERLAERFWPGPLTLVVTRAPGGTICDLACAGLTTVGLRVPSHPVAAALLRGIGRPVAAPSANKSGRLSPTSVAAVRADFGVAVPVVLDGGACAVGVESTIVACVGRTVALLRTGAITPDEIAETLGRPLDAPDSGLRAPGMLRSHYAPNAALRLDVTMLESAEAGLDFAGQLGVPSRLDLSPRGDLREAAANLYNYLRKIDSEKPRIIAVAPIPDAGLGLAINDRLRRAAAPRD